jgi:hypothetical protein
LNFDFLRGLLPSHPAPPSASFADNASTTVADNGSIASNVYTTVAGNGSVADKRSRRQSLRGHGELILALMHAGRALSVTELATCMRCSVGEASRRVTAAGDLVQCRREGRRKHVRLREMRMLEWIDLASSARAMCGQ